MTRAFVCILLVCLVAGAGLAAADRVTVQGFLVDRMCASQHAAEGEKFGVKHGRDCALMADCVKSGYGVLTADGKFIKFDAEGDKRAEAALKSSKKKDNLRVTVTGTQEGDTLQVASLKLQ